MAVKYLDLNGLDRYDTLIKNYIEANYGSSSDSQKHTITVNSGKKSDNSTDISATSTSAVSPSVTLADSGASAGAYGDTSNLTPAYGATFKVPSISVNAKGIVTAIGEHTVKIPASDNTNDNQKIKSGSITFGVNDVIDIVAGSNVTVTPDATNKKIIIASSYTNTTYTFANGTTANTFVVTPSGGSAQTVTVTPSIANNVTANGNFVANAIIVGNGANLVAKNSGVTISTTAPSGDSADTTVPTSKAVWSAISSGIAANDAMVYSGTIDGGSTGTYGALTPAASKGNTYKVTVAGKINGIAVEVGDLLICNTDNTAAATSSNYSTIAASWDYIQTNIDGAVTGPTSSTDAHVAVFNGTTGKVIKDSGFTIGKSVPANAVFTDTDTKVTSSANHYIPATVNGNDKTASATGATAAWSIDVVKGITVNTDGKGHITGLSVTSGKIPANPNTDTSVTSASNHYTPVKNNNATKSASGATGAAETTVLVITGIETDGKGHVTGIISGAATDTNTKVTSAANHYTPSTASGGDKSASASGATAAWSIDVVKGVTLNTDGKGHVTGISVTSGKIPANPNTDTKVADTAGTGKAFLLGHTTQGTTAEAVSNANVYMSSGKLYSNNKEVALAEDFVAITYGTGSLNADYEVDALFA